MHKIINFRSVAVFGLSLVLGGYFLVYVFHSFVVGAALVAAVSLFVILFVCFGKHKNVIFLKRFLCVILVPFVLGASGVFIKESVILNSTPKSGSFEIEGKVNKIVEKEDGGYYIYLTSVELEGADETFNPSGIVRMSVSSRRMAEDVRIGDTVCANGSFVNYYKSGENENFFNARSGYSGRFTASDNIKVYSGSGIKYSITNAAKTIIDENMEPGLASVAFGMLFGDKSGIDPELNMEFSTSGLAHVLAVSGLHVGFIVSLLGLILGLIIKNKKSKTIIMSLLIIFYAYLCGFSASIVRASVMSITMMAAGVGGKQYDGINALALSALINFVLNPLCIFSISFLLSYSVVFAIFALTPSLTCSFAKRLPLKVASSLAVSVAAWIGSVALLMMHMSSFSFYSIIVNILMIPFVGITFMCLCVITIISIVPFFRFLFVVPNALYKILVYVVEGVANLKYACLEITGNMFGVIVCTLAVLLASDYVFHKNKYLFSSMFVLSFFVLTIL